MQCVADKHYEIVRDRHTDEIKWLRCMFCQFAISKRRTPKPRTSTSGLGRYNRMRGQMVAHLHKHHRDKLIIPKRSAKQDVVDLFGLE